MTINQIKQYIINGENEQIEFKEKIDSTDQLSAEIIALANTQGGAILIGVSDRGEVKGIEDYQQLEQTMTNILRQNIYPPLTAEIKSFDFQGKTILALKVPKSDNRPHQNKTGQYFVRVGSSKRQASTQELARIFQDGGQIEYDAMPLRDTSIRDIDLNKVNDYFHKVYQRDLYSEDLPPEQILLNMCILKSLDNKSQATVGGMLCFGINPQTHPLLKSAIIKLAVHSGEDETSEIIKREDIAGTIDKQIEKAEELIRFYTKTKSFIKNEFKREEKPQYPLPAIREIVINAAAHRNYSISGSAIRILIFSNRIHVLSPGRLPNSITLENLGYASRIRNQFLVTILHQLRYVEDLGEGIIKARRWLRQNGNPDPRFELFDEIFKVTMFGVF